MILKAVVLQMQCLNFSNGIAMTFFAFAEN